MKKVTNIHDKSEHKPADEGAEDHRPRVFWLCNCKWDKYWLKEDMTPVCTRCGEALITK